MNVAGIEHLLALTLAAAWITLLTWRHKRNRQEQLARHWLTHYRNQGIYATDHKWHGPFKTKLRIYLRGQDLAEGSYIEVGK